MRAYLLNDPATAIDAEALQRHGVLSWSNAADRIDAIKREHGYTHDDMIELTPATPDLAAICAKFDKEHLHTEDEVRFVVAGAGIFDVRDDGSNWVRIEVSEGDLIVIPANKYHRFHLTESKHIRCMRLFTNGNGWAPIYRDPLPSTAE
jgi:1,2-dihydroxy-3-keto-5-methylthiopentene dioxygenase